MNKIVILLRTKLMLLKVDACKLGVINTPYYDSSIKVLSGWVIWTVIDVGR